jgi:hypothetical protein
LSWAASATEIPSPAASVSVPLITAMLPITFRQSIRMWSLCPSARLSICASPVTLPSLDFIASNANVRSAVTPVLLVNSY